jgi:CxxC-x17-CxxC domain-containing protein
MFQGSWTCSKCGGEITQLPFEPRSNSGLTCRDCYFNNKQGTAQGSDSPEVSDTDTGSSADLDDRDIPDFDPDMAGSSELQEDSGRDEAEAAPAGGGRQMFEGDWKCSVCGADIKSLPFKPYNTEGLKCLDCFKKG